MCVRETVNAYMGNVGMHVSKEKIWKNYALWKYPVLKKGFMRVQTGFIWQRQGPDGASCFYCNENLNHIKLEEILSSEKTIRFSRETGPCH